MRINNNHKMDLHEAIECAMLHIKAGYINFFLDTKFGNIPVELGNFFDFIAVKNWNTCEPTKFIINNRGCDHKFVLRIQYIRNQHDDLTKMQIAWGLCNCMLYHINNNSYVSDIFVDAVFAEYIKNYIPYGRYMKYYVKLYIDSRNRFAKFNKSSYDMLIKSTTKNTQTRLENAYKLSDECYDLIKIHIKPNDFGSSYYDRIFAICMKFKYTCRYDRNIYNEITSKIKYDIHSLDLILKIIKYVNNH